MKNFDKFSQLLSVFLLLTTSCSDNDENNGNLVNPTEINTNITIDDSESHFGYSFESGDQIGIFAYSVIKGERLESDLVWDVAENVKLTYDGSQWKADNEKFKHPGNIYYINVYAYFPYVDNANPLSLSASVPEDQESSSLKDAIFMIASATNVGSLEELKLTFAHQMKVINVTVPIPTIFGTKPNGVPTAIMNKIEREFRADIVSGTISTPYTIGRSIHMKISEDGKNYIYKAVLPGQHIDGDRTTVNLVAEYGASTVEHELAIPDLEEGNGDIELELPFMVETVRVNSGTFLMGSPSGEPGRWDDEFQHSITLTKSFYMATYPTTNAQYSLFLNKVGVPQNGRFETRDYGERLILRTSAGTAYPWGVYFDEDEGIWKPMEGFENNPINFITWYGANEFATWLGGRIPTEAEWEYSCRAGTETIFSFGDVISDEIANYDARYAYNGSPIGELRGMTTPVNTFPSNPWGLYDMHGNLSEWCQDMYDEDIDYYRISPAEDPTGPAVGHGTVLRGGQYNMRGGYLRSAMRDYSNPNDAGGYFGTCRVVFTIEE